MVILLSSILLSLFWVICFVSLTGNNNYGNNKNAAWHNMLNIQRGIMSKLHGVEKVTSTETTKVEGETNDKQFILGWTEII